jgi:Oxidoreductase family, C-terminal alpha/beta domain/Oxidoreductase family, NAD-binding Rossmann fold
MFIDACNAGKDVYVEKPLSLTVVEGRKMVEAADRTKRVAQVGTQRRSSPFLKEAADFVRGGGIGKVTVAKSYHLDNQWPEGIGNPPNGSPASLDFFARAPVDRESERAYRPSHKAVIEPRVVKGTESAVLDARNFLECIKSRGKCNADILTGHLSTSATLLGNIALKTESHLKWDGHAERFTNNEAANKWLRYKYRPPYKLG